MKDPVLQAFTVHIATQCVTAGNISHTTGLINCSTLQCQTAALLPFSRYRTSISIWVKLGLLMKVNYCLVLLALGSCCHATLKSQSSQPDNYKRKKPTGHITDVSTNACKSVKNVQVIKHRDNTMHRNIMYCGVI